MPGHAQGAKSAREEEAAPSAGAAGAAAENGDASAVAVVATRDADVDESRSPFERLPDELIVAILLKVEFKVLWCGACKRVCKRWVRLMDCAPIKRLLRDGRWAAYEAKIIVPRKLRGHQNAARALALGPDGKVCVTRESHLCVGV
jgi:hypothetical protein